MQRRHVVSICIGLALAATHSAQTQEVQRVEVRDSGLVGRFYATVGAPRRTAVLMLTGSGGGYPDEAPARDLARAGYPVFALAYSATAKDIPRSSSRRSFATYRWNTSSRRSIGSRRARKSEPTASP